MLVDWIYKSSPWLSLGVFILFGIIVSGVVVAVMTRLINAQARREHNEFTALTVTNIAVLYTVLLAFIAVAAWEDLSKASDVTATEAGLVEDLYLDAQGFDDAEFTKKLQSKLIDYIKAVVGTEWPVQQAGGVSRAGAPALRDFRLTLVAPEPRSHGDQIVMAEMLRSLNSLFDARRSRRDAAAGQIPSAVWWVVSFLGLLTIGLMAALGMRSRWMQFALAASLTTAIVVVVVLIVQLDHPFSGEFSISSRPFQEVLKDVKHD